MWQRFLCRHAKKRLSINGFARENAQNMKKSWVGI